MRDYLADLMRSIAFLSRIQVPGRYFEGHDGGLSRTVRAFPVAGFVIILPAALLGAALAALEVDALVSAVLVVGVMTASTGALHEDGLADTADGLGAGHDAPRALQIMKDSRTGVYGVAALALALMLRVATLAALMTALTPAAFIATMAAAAAISRAAMVWHWHRLPDARGDGVAARMGRPETRAMSLALAAAGLLSLPTLVTAGPAPWLLAVALASLVTVVFSWRTRARLGGCTGDTIGACQQMSELAFLTGLVLCL
jgi:adenosylcobinamide-GDP ribazoletransferase